ncbi:Zn(2)-C6 fungal-type domain-containing protein [Fusarium falciforme]|uniref:Zn(2)-C6 fungal-type domain-containing protein n=1 Tax=Fusarium falciforme TaxID=195108 RepID=UPI0023001496|nr:Zn(2)-C6 fungal-type domain-containing protein [Fusarium falciforme]WAO88763.1 Zn(2)-C6 fungal-type domain-containing protein [Fusarium falciforme]
MVPRKRAFHPRKRTGCITCKIRRVRCDEQKPSCNRCLSTGRKCDGYANNISTELPSPPASANPSSSETRLPRRNATIPMTLVLPLPRRNDQELRSYRFFLDVTASEFAGVFDADFWLTDIPRTCHSDPAIWHAVVSLGAAHQGYLASRGSARAESTSPFAVYQYNQAVKHLVHLPSSRTIPEERLRALIASVLFTYLCSIQGLHSQSGVHLAAAKSLLRELQTSNPSQSKLDATQVNQSKVPEYLTASSVSYKAVLSIIASLELQSQALNNRNANETPEILRDVDAYTAWRYYTAPNPTESSRICQHSRCVPSRATPENIARAGRAFQSLLDALILLSQRIRPDKAGSLRSADKAMENPISQQQPYTRAFHELDTALNMFVSDSSGNCLCFGPPDQLSSSTQHRNKAIDSLRVFRAVCHPLLDYLMGDSDANLKAHAIQLLDMAESVLGNEARYERSDATEFIPSLSITQPVFVVAATGPTLALRRRAMALLRQYPRREGLWDSLFTAAFLEACLEHEIELFRGGSMAGQAGLDEVEAIPASCQVRWAVFRFTGAHTARVKMQTLAEWLDDEPGREVPLVW